MTPLRPPLTAISPTVDTLHGQRISDPYRWLEDQTASSTRAWVSQQFGYTRGYLDALPDRDALRARVRQLVDVEFWDTPLQCGQRLFFLRRLIGEQQPSICLSIGPEAVTCLLNPASLDLSGATSVHMIAPSGDGRYLAFGIRHGGEDFQTVGVLDVHKRALLPDRLPPGCWCQLEWDEAEDGFYYFQRYTGLPRAIYFHRLGCDPRMDRVVFRAPDSEDLGVWFQKIAKDLLLCLVRREVHPFDNHLFIVDLTSAEIESLFEIRSAHFAPIALGQRVIALTEFGAPNRHVVTFSLSNAAPNRWVDIVSEERRLVKRLGVVSGQVFVSYADAEGSLIKRFTLQGTVLTPLVEYFPGTSEIVPTRPTDGAVFYRTESFLHSPTIHRFNPATGANDVWFQARHTLRPDSYQMRQHNTASKDGTAVPYWELSRPTERDASECRPTVITSYAGFATTMTPRFSILIAVLLERGFRFLLINARGGGEYGEAWHQAGARRNRQKSFDDVISVAETTIARGLTAPRHLGIIGGSNSGLVVGALLTQRPDLFRAVLCIAPLLDMLRYHLFDAAKHYIDEYGCADDPNDFRALVAYSPYHNVRDGTAYPAALFVTGEKDTRCNSLHVRKMVARLQAATAATLPILLDHSELRGHAPTLPLSTRIEALVDRLSFLVSQLSAPERMS